MKKVQAVHAKLVEDKTFGLKNKNKSKKVQKFVQTVEKQTRGGAQILEKQAEAAQRVRPCCMLLPPSLPWASRAGLLLLHARHRLTLF